MQRTRNPEATRAALLDAAEEVFLEKGLGDASVSEIARRAGITKSLVHHHFGSKEGLWQQVKQRRFMQYAERQMEMLTERPPDVQLVRESIQTYFRFLRDNPQIARLLAWMFLEGDSGQCMDAERELTSAGVAKLREAQQAGRLRTDVDPRFMLFTFLGAAQHWFQEREHFCCKFDAEDLPADVDEAYLADFLKIFMEGILPR